MKFRRVDSILVVLAVLVGVGLALRIAWNPPAAIDGWAMALFGLLMLATPSLGAPMGGGLASLLPLATMGAYLALGWPLTAVLAFLAAWVYTPVRTGLRNGFHFVDSLQKPGVRWAQVATLQTAARCGANALLQVGGLWAGHLTYLALRGTSPLDEMQVAPYLAGVLAGMVYLGVSAILTGVVIAVHRRDAWQNYWFSVRELLLLEGVQTWFAPLLAVVYVRLGAGALALTDVAALAAGWVTRRLALTSQRMVRQYNELDSLQAVGSALSNSLELEAVLDAVYHQVRRVMPADSFFAALLDPSADEITYPFVMAGKQRLNWPARSGGRALAEYLRASEDPTSQRFLRSLAGREMSAALRSRLGDPLGQTAAPTAWIGAPLLAGQELLGLLVVQAARAEEEYDQEHLDMLATIANHSALAIQNARLYARTDKALQRRVQELDSILRSVQDGILLVGLRGEVLEANRAAGELLGMSTVELSGGNLFHCREGEDTPTLLGALGLSAESFQSQTNQLSRREREQISEGVNLSGRAIERTISPVWDGQNELQAWLVVLHDRTEEAVLQRFRDEMLFMLVHDLRSPLAVLQGALATLREAWEEGDEAALERLYSLSQRVGRRALRLVNSLLDVAKLESGQISLDIGPLDIEALLTNVAAVNVPTPGAHQRVRIEIAEELVPVYADVIHIERVLGNLMDNALKFTPDGGEIVLWARSGGPRSVRIGVRDDGPGVPVDARQTLFDKFFQAAGPRGRRAGSGLGLYYCRLAIAAHGGRIWVEDSETGGSNFVIELPHLIPGEPVEVV